MRVIETAGKFGIDVELKGIDFKRVMERMRSKISKEGAHIIGPHASILIQEIVNLMYTPEQSAAPIRQGMHIHPALSEVVERAFSSLMPPSHYHHTLKHFQLEN